MLFASVLLSIFAICFTIVLIILCKTEFDSDEIYVFPSVSIDGKEEDNTSSIFEPLPTCSSAPLSSTHEEVDESVPLIIDLGLFDCYYGRPKNSDGVSSPMYMLSTVGFRSDFSTLDFGNCQEYSKCGFEYKFLMANVENVERYFIDFVTNIINKSDLGNKKIRLLIVGPELDYDNEIRKKMTQLLFECSNVTHLCITKPSEMAAFALEKKNAIIIHSDGISTNIVPVIEGESSDYLLRFENSLVDYKNLTKFYMKNQTKLGETVNASSTGISKLVIELLSDLGDDYKFTDTIVSGRSLSFKRMKEWKSIPNISKSEYKPEELVWMGACKFATNSSNQRWVSLQ